MKNYKKGFVVPLLIAIIAVLVIGGGAYVYQNNKTVATNSQIDLQDEKITDQNQSTSTSSNPVSPIANSSKNPVIKNVQQYDTDSPNLIKSNFKVTLSGENLFICNNPRDCETLVYIGNKSFSLMETPTNGYSVSFIPSNLTNGDYDLYLYNPINGIRSNSVKVKVATSIAHTNDIVLSGHYTYNNTRYQNTNYRFSVQYPPGTQVDTTPGNQIDIPNTIGKIVTFQPSTTEGYVVIEVLDLMLPNDLNCTNTTAGSDPSYKTFNGVNFTIYNLDRILSRNTSVSARLYCVMKDDIQYKIITVLPYTNSPLNVDKDSTLNQMVASFKFTN